MRVFFFNDTATTEIYSLSLHDALPILSVVVTTTCALVHGLPFRLTVRLSAGWRTVTPTEPADRKSTRLNSSHPSISYAVFCLKKKKKSKVITSVRVRVIIV